MTIDRQMETRLTRVAILEDDPNIRAHLASAVEAHPELELAAVAGSLGEADAIVEARPDVALVDLGLPDGSGVDVISRLHAETDARVVVITIFRDRDSVLRSLAAGADGYLLKDSSAAEILNAIRAAMDGGAPISPEAARHLLERVARLSETASPNAVSSPLTARELELLTLFSKGLTYREAARALGISPHTVGDHVKSIYRKLDVTSRGEAVFEATQSGLIHPFR